MGRRQRAQRPQKWSGLLSNVTTQDGNFLALVAGSSRGALSGGSIYLAINLLTYHSGIVLAAESYKLTVSCCEEIDEVGVYP